MDDGIADTPIWAALLEEEWVWDGEAVARTASMGISKLPQLLGLTIPQLFMHRADDVIQ